MRIDFPAPVSPVNAEKPDLKSKLILSTMTKSRIDKLSNIVLY
jgi:hypothetical protein